MPWAKKFLPTSAYDTKDVVTIRTTSVNRSGELGIRSTGDPLARHAAQPVFRTRVGMQT